MESKFVSINVIVGFNWEVFVAGYSLETAKDEISVGGEAIENTVVICTVFWFGVACTSLFALKVVELVRIAADAIG